MYSSEQAWAPAKEGNKVIFIRHALAPGGGDPSGFEISNCKIVKMDGRSDKAYLEKWSDQSHRTKFSINFVHSNIILFCIYSVWIRTI